MKEEIVWAAAGMFIGGLVMLIISILSRQRLAREKFQAESQASLLQRDNTRLQQQVAQQQDDIVHLNRHTAELTAQKTYLQEKLNTQLLQIDELQKQFRLQFEHIAGSIMEENSEKFTRQNKENLQHVLEPLREKIREFEERVRVTHKESSDQNTVLREQINYLKDLGLKMSAETHSLTQALKGDTKQQGNWGELVLERVLEASGLEKGREFDSQLHVRDDKGNLRIPDVVIYLPEEKHIIIDAKVSLTAYEEWVRADDETGRQKSLVKHLTSLKNHINGLSERHYVAAAGLRSPDFVLLFLPIEASLGVSLQCDSQLFEYAWKRKIVLVTPGTLLATLKTVASLWKYEKQNANAMKIADMGRKLYEQFADFLDEMEKIDRAIEAARLAYSEAMNRLSGSSHSIMRRAEKLKSYGISPKKQLQSRFLNLTEDIIPLNYADDEPEDEQQLNDE